MPSESTDGTAGASSSAAEAGASSAAADEWRGKGPRLEQPVGLHSIKQALPISDKEVSEFAPPRGWLSYTPKSERNILGTKWIRQGPKPAKEDESRPNAVTGRVELEHQLEDEARQDKSGGPWLGQLVGGQWEIRRGAVDAALEWVMAELVGEGLVRSVPAEECGKGSGALFAAANLYVRGEPFPRKAGAKKEEDEEPEEEEELCDFEIQRQRNIARNQELLRQLGLA